MTAKNLFARFFPNPSPIDLPLLDGLDEVAAIHRGACVDTVNYFRREHGLLQIAVCSRLADYEALGTKLRLRSAIEVQPLSKQQVEDYLSRVGEPLLGLRTAVREDPVFWELLETPLMLWVAMLAYRDEPKISTPDASFEQRVQNLFAHFVEAMFGRRARQRRYSPEQTTRWLSYLARTLRAQSHTVFYLENLDFGWLPTRTNRWLVRTGIVIGGGLMFGLLSLLMTGVIGGMRDRSIDGLIPGLALGASVGMLANLSIIRPVETARVRIAFSSRYFRYASIVGIVVGFGFGWGVALPEQDTGLIVRLIHPGVILDSIICLGCALIFGSIFGLVFGLIKVLTSKAIQGTRALPDQGTRDSVKIAVIVGLILGVLLPMPAALLLWLGFFKTDPLLTPLGDFINPSNMVVFGSIVGFVVAMVFGGLFALKHGVLRLALWQSKSAPLRYIAFLNEAKDLLFLRQVGGGYIFTHRLLREYLASLPQPGSGPNLVSSNSAYRHR